MRDRPRPAEQAGADAGDGESESEGDAAVGTRTVNREPRGGRRGRDHLQRERDRDCARRRPLLERGHLGQQGTPRDGADPEGPQAGARPSPAGHRVVEQGRTETDPSPADAGGQTRGKSAAEAEAAQRVRHGKGNRQPRQNADGAAAGEAARARRRRPTEHTDRDRNRHTARVLPCADSLAEHADPEDEQHDEPEAECGLDESDRAERQCARLERPGGKAYRRACLPRTTGDEAPKQRGAQTVACRSDPRLERLERRREREQRRRGCGKKDRDGGAHAAIVSTRVDRVVAVALLTLVPGALGGSERYTRELLRSLAAIGTLDYHVIVPQCSHDPRAPRRNDARRGASRPASRAHARRVSRPLPADAPDPAWSGALGGDVARRPAPGPARDVSAQRTALPERRLAQVDPRSGPYPRAKLVRARTRAVPAPARRRSCQSRRERDRSRQVHSRCDLTRAVPALSSSALAAQEPRAPLRGVRRAP